jgi:hypothetical protein
MRPYICLLPLVVPALLMAQSPAARGTDARILGWQLRLDRPDADMSRLTFVDQQPGVRITTGPAGGIFFRPELTATGNFTVTATFEFLPPPPGAMQEGYGLLLGGKDLIGMAPEYLYLLVRNDGKFLLKMRTGPATKDIIPWTSSPAITRLGAGPGVTNVLTVRATRDVVEFRVNGVSLATRPRSEVAVDGVVGIRVNHFSDVRISNVTVAGIK